MEVLPVKFTYVDKKKVGLLPSYATEGSSGMDLRASLPEIVVLQPKGIHLFPTNIAVELEEGYELQIRPRSGLALQHGITVINSPGTIDSDYRGEIKIALINHSTVPYSIFDGDKIAQMVLGKFTKISLVYCSELSETVRGSGGFGHTGISYTPHEGAQKKLFDKEVEGDGTLPGNGHL